jgi:hypothetical protein
MNNAISYSKPAVKLQQQATDSDSEVGAKQSRLAAKKHWIMSWDKQSTSSNVAQVCPFLVSSSSI